MSSPLSTLVEQKQKGKKQKGKKQKKRTLARAGKERGLAVTLGLLGVNLGGLGGLGGLEDGLASLVGLALAAALLLDDLFLIFL